MPCPGENSRIRAAIDLLASNPRPPGCVAMTGEAYAYRVRVGDCRIVYSVFDDRLVVEVVRIGHRRDVYPSSSERSVIGAGRRQQRARAPCTAVTPPLWRALL